MIFFIWLYRKSFVFVIRFSFSHWLSRQYADSGTTWQSRSVRHSSPTFSKPSLPPGTLPTHLAAAYPGIGRLPFRHVVNFGYGIFSVSILSFLFCKHNLTDLLIKCTGKEVHFPAIVQQIAQKSGEPHVLRFLLSIIFQYTQF